MQGDAVPGMPTDVVYNDFDYFSLNQAGQVVFRSHLSGQGIDGNNDETVWSEQHNTLILVAREGDPAPGTTIGTVFGRPLTPALNIVFRDLRIDNTGNAIFKGYLAGTDIEPDNNRGIWTKKTDGLSLIAREGDSVSEAGEGVVITALDAILHSNPDGETSLIVSLGGQGIDSINDVGVLKSGNGASKLILQGGDAAPGTAAGTVFSEIYRMSFNGNGDTVVIAEVAGPNINSFNDRGIWLESSGSLDLVAREGDAISGLGEGAIFHYINEVRLNTVGQIAFADRAMGDAAWVQSGNTLSLIAYEGGVAQGANDGETYNEINQGSFLINSAGTVLFGGGITGPNTGFPDDAALWTGTNEQLQVIAREGQHAPGTEPGIMFDDTLRRIYPELNASGQVLFGSYLTGTGIDSGNDFGLWATDPDGTLKLIVREGQFFDVNTDPLIEDLRIILYIEAVGLDNSSGEDGRRIIFNNAGQLVLKLSFTDGTSGIFVANTRLPGDLNADGFVGIDDLTAVLNNWNQNVTPGDLLAGDATGDGFVGIDDLNTVLPNWNTGTPPPSTLQNPASNIPEPASVLIFTSLLGWQLRRL